jgi:Kef-type K+ transport system membrane component KefB
VHAAGPVSPIPSHQLMVLLTDVSVLLLLAFLAGRAAMRLKMPAIVGELTAGVLAGPSALAHLAPPLSRWLLPHDPVQIHLLDAVAQLGLLLLVGITGIQIDLVLVRRRAGQAAITGITGLVIPLAAGTALATALPGSLIPEHASRATFALFIGVAVGVSAIPVIAKTLTDLRLLHRDIGQLILCAVTVDDIVGWILLAVVSGIATGRLTTGGVGRLLGGLALVIVIGVAARPLARAGLRAAAAHPDPGPLTAALVVAIVAAAAGTQALGLEAVFGAFAAGLVISSCGGVEPARLAPLRVTVLSALAPLYFATAGLRMDLTALAQPQVLLWGVAVLAVAIAAKFAGAYAGARLSRLGNWPALALGAGMNSRGVVEVVVALVGLQLGLLTPAMYTIIVLVAIVTTLMAPPLLRWATARIDASAEETMRMSVYGDSGALPAAGIPGR